MVTPKGGHNLRPLPGLADAKADANFHAMTDFSLGGRKKRSINAQKEKGRVMEVYDALTGNGFLGVFASA